MAERIGDNAQLVEVQRKIDSLQKVVATLEDFYSDRPYLRTMFENMKIELDGIFLTLRDLTGKTDEDFA